ARAPADELLPVEGSEEGAMTPTEQDLAQQLAAHPQWRWMRGMCALTAGHPVDEFRVTYPEALREASEIATCIPDLADPATQGCLLAALGDQLQVVETFYASLDPGAVPTWRVETGDGEDYPWA